MPVSASEHRFDVPADYLDGDPEEPSPLTGGILTLAPGGILFDRDGSGFAAELDELEGITVTGSRVRRPGYETSTRGYTKVALIRNGERIIWEFSIDRADGSELRDMLNRVREASGREPLPYVEELHGFGERASTQATSEMQALTPEAVRRDAERRRRRAEPSLGRVHARRGRSDPRIQRRATRERPRGRGRLTVRQRRLILAAVGAMVFLEITLPLLILKVL
jgi:hypothetical protein